MFRYIFAVLFFALSMTFIMSWGLIKEQRKRSELYNKLLIKVEGEIKNAFNKNILLSKKEIISLIKDTKTKLFWSKSKIEVSDAEKIVEKVINQMIKKNEIQKVENNYRLIK